MDPMMFLALVAVVLFGLMMALFWRPFWRIQSKRRANRYARYKPRNWWRRVRKRPVFEVDLPTVRDFVLTLQLSLSLAETMAGALNQAAKQFGDRGTFGKRLITRVRSQLQVEPEAVIRALATDFNNEHLAELSERLEMAHEGGLSYSEAVNTTLDDIEEEIRIRVEKDIERAPVILTIPMIMGVFFMTLLLLGAPLILLFVKNMGGAASAGAAAIPGGG